MRNEVGRVDAGLNGRGAGDGTGVDGRLSADAARNGRAVQRHLLVAVDAARRDRRVPQLHAAAESAAGDRVVGILADARLGIVRRPARIVRPVRPAQIDTVRDRPAGDIYLVVAIDAVDRQFAALLDGQLADPGGVSADVAFFEQRAAAGVVKPAGGRLVERVHTPDIARHAVERDRREFVDVPAAERAARHIQRADRGGGIPPVGQRGRDAAVEAAAIVGALVEAGAAGADAEPDLDVGQIDRTVALDALADLGGAQFHTARRGAGELFVELALHLHARGRDPAYGAAVIAGRIEIGRVGIILGRRFEDDGGELAAEGRAGEVHAAEADDVLVEGPADLPLGVAQFAGLRIVLAVGVRVGYLGFAVDRSLLFRLLGQQPVARGIDAVERGVGDRHDRVARNVAGARLARETAEDRRARRGGAGEAFRRSLVITAVGNVVSRFADDLGVSALEQREVAARDDGGAVIVRRTDSGAAADEQHADRVGLIIAAFDHRRICQGIRRVGDVIITHPAAIEHVRLGAHVEYHSGIPGQTGLERRIHELGSPVGVSGETRIRGDERRIVGGDAGGDADRLSPRAVRLGDVRAFADRQNTGRDASDGRAVLLGHLQRVGAGHDKGVGYRVAAAVHGVCAGVVGPVA